MVIFDPHTGARPAKHSMYVLCNCTILHQLTSNQVLAVQNLEASGIIAKDQAVEFNALEGSLSMMSKGEFPPFFPLNASVTWPLQSSTMCWTCESQNQCIYRQLNF